MVILAGEMSVDGFVSFVRCPRDGHRNGVGRQMPNGSVTSAQESEPTRARRRNRQVTRREEISPEFAQVLRDHFRDDVAELGELIGRDLSGWTR